MQQDLYIYMTNNQYQYFFKKHLVFFSLFVWVKIQIGECKSTIVVCM